MTDVANKDLALNIFKVLNLKHRRPYCHTIWLLTLKSDERAVSLLSKYSSIQFVPNMIFTMMVVFKDPPPSGFLHGDCTRNHTVQKYRSYKVNF